MLGVVLRALVFVVVLVGPTVADEGRVRDFALRMGLRDVDGFVETVDSLRRTGELPERYVTKQRARDLGWWPGGDLCLAAPGKVIGGDRFGNFEQRLPDKPERRWREADLDFACGRRGAKRLVWSNDGLFFVTTDHYETFKRVPP